MTYIKKYYEFKKTILTKEEQDSFDFILQINENQQMNEGVMDRLKTIAKKGLLTTALLSTLLSTNTAFANEYKSLDKADKQEIELLINDTKETKQDGDIFTIDFSKSFVSGRYKLDQSSKKEVIQKLNQLKDYINSNNSSKYTLTIVASESTVPNRDVDTGEYLEDMELAQRRSNEMKNIINDFLKNSNIPNIKIETKNILGKETYKRGDNPRDERFTKDQFVRIEMVANKVDTENMTTLCDFVGQIPGEQASKEKGYVSYYKKIDVTDQYGTGQIVLEPGSIPDRVILKADGKIIGDSGFFGIGQNERSLEFKYIPASILELTKLSQEGFEIDSHLHKHQRVTVNSYEELLDILMNPSDRGSKTDWLNYKFNVTDITYPLREMKKMIEEQGVKEFVLYSQTQNNIDYDLGGKYKSVEVIVQSPVGRTKYDLNINCGINFK